MSTMFCAPLLNVDINWMQERACLSYLRAPSVVGVIGFICVYGWCRVIFYFSSRITVRLLDFRLKARCTKGNKQQQIQFDSEPFVFATWCHPSHTAYVCVYRMRNLLTKSESQWISVTCSTSSTHRSQTQYPECKTHEFRCMRESVLYNCVCVSTRQIFLQSMSMLLVNFSLEYLTHKFDNDVDEIDQRPIKALGERKAMYIRQ